MSTYLIESHDQLEVWLEETGWLEDACVELLAPAPAEGGPLPFELVLRVSTLTHGGWRAGETAQFTDWEIVCRGLSELSLCSRGFIKDYCTQGVEHVLSDPGVGLVLDVPGQLRFRGASLHIGGTVRSEVVGEFLGTEFSVQVPGASLPPAAWLDWFAQADVDVVWRVFGEDAELTAAIPEDYSGWFLQRRDRLNADDGGLLVRNLTVADGVLSVTISGQWSEVAPLWRIASLGLTAVPGARFRCGNVEGAGAEWPEYLRRIPEGPDGA